MWCFILLFLWEPIGPYQDSSALHSPCLGRESSSEEFEWASIRSASKRNAKTKLQQMKYIVIRLISYSCTCCINHNCVFPSIMLSYPQSVIVACCPICGLQAKYIREIPHHFGSCGIPQTTDSWLELHGHNQMEDGCVKVSRIRRGGMNRRTGLGVLSTEGYIISRRAPLQVPNMAESPIISSPYTPVGHPYLQQSSQLFVVLLGSNLSLVVTGRAPNACPQGSKGFACQGDDTSVGQRRRISLFETRNHDINALRWDRDCVQWLNSCRPLQYRDGVSRNSSRIGAQWYVVTCHWIRKYSRNSVVEHYLMPVRIICGWPKTCLPYSSQK